MTAGSGWSRPMAFGGWTGCRRRMGYGNPVRIGDGCATVTDYRLPRPLNDASRSGRRERGLKSEVRISTPVVLVTVLPEQSHFSDIEKDEASPWPRVRSGGRRMPCSRFVGSDGLEFAVPPGPWFSNQAQAICFLPSLHLVSGST